MNNLLALDIFGFFKGATSIIVAILVLLFMVTVHEFGHYIVGKKLGFKINEFAIGFGPALFKRTMKSGEVFSIRAFPLGGYCAFEGEDSESADDRAFEKKHPLKRIAVLVSGAAANFIVAWLLIVVTFMTAGQYMLSAGEVLPSQPYENIASENILKKDDVILEINGTKIHLSTDLSKALAGLKSGDSAQILVVNGVEKQLKTIKIRDYYYSYKENGETITREATGLGILQGSKLVRYNVLESIGRGTVYCFKMAGQVLGFLGGLFTGRVGLDTLSGPVSTITMTAEIAMLGFRQLIEIMVLIGVNLAVFNLLPIPALDGSKVVFTVVEMVRKKPINKNVEAIIHFAGFIFILGFAVFVDLLKVF